MEAEEGSGAMEDAGGRGSNHRASRPQAGGGGAAWPEAAFPGVLCQRPPLRARVAGMGQAGFASQPRESQRRNGFQCNVKRLEGKKKKSYRGPEAATVGLGERSSLNSTPSFTTCTVTLGKSLNLLEPLFLDRLGFLGEGNQIIYVRYILEIIDA